MTITPEKIAELRDLTANAKKPIGNTFIYYHDHVDVILANIPDLLNALEAEVDHAVDSVRPPTTDANDLYHGEVVIARARCRIRFAVCHHGLRDP